MSAKRLVRRSIAKKKSSASGFVNPAKTQNALAQSIVSAVRKKVKTSTISTLDQSSAMSDVREWIPSGFRGLDEILGGGWAVGRASEVFGDEGCGKTALAHRAIKSVQDAGGIAVLLDFEAALDERIVEQLGIDGSRLIHEIPDHAEQGWDIVWAIITQLKASKPDAPFLIVWDSIGGSVTKSELEGDAGKALVGDMARIMSRNCRKMFKAIAKVRAHMMWISQERHKIGGFSPFGPVKETSGGKGPKYAASQRLRCAKVKTLSQGKRKIGYQIKSITKKNRLAPPEQSMEWVIDFKHGPSPDLSTLQVLLDAGKVKKVKGKMMFPPFGKAVVFKRSEWLGLMQDPAKKGKAEEIYLAVVRAGGALAFRDPTSGADEVSSED